SIDVETTGPQSTELADALEALVADRFGEDM
ncbi:MAG: HPr family phosphocarrier protein, partial [Donghicola eburneus]|nr:HPr family phosphocarrier protein [Donghicola eburneus]